MSRSNLGSMEILCKEGNGGYILWYGGVTSSQSQGRVSMASTCGLERAVDWEPEDAKREAPLRHACSVTTPAIRRDKRGRRAACVQRRTHWRCEVLHEEVSFRPMVGYFGDGGWDALRRRKRFLKVRTPVGGRPKWPCSGCCPAAGQSHMPGLGCCTCSASISAALARDADTPLANPGPAWSGRILVAPEAAIPHPVTIFCRQEPT